MLTLPWHGGRDMVVSYIPFPYPFTKQQNFMPVQIQSNCSSQCNDTKWMKGKLTLSQTTNGRPFQIEGGCR